eukprot:Skav224547  [mRNA]  locus=scaffold2085:41226:42428:- [translate_table: standard]
MTKRLSTQSSADGQHGMNGRRVVGIAADSLWGIVNVRIVKGCNGTSGIASNYNAVHINPPLLRHASHEAHSRFRILLDHFHDVLGPIRVGMSYLE